MPDLIVDIQHISDSPTSPDDEEIASWVSSALTHHPDNIASAELSVRIVDDTEMAALNENYRSKQGPTNVMSFPFEPPPGFPEDDAHPLLGDIIICAPMVEREAMDQNKASHTHWAHMVVHGTLHLLGYDHQTDRDADIMENMETNILASLGIANPYQATSENNN